MSSFRKLSGLTVAVSLSLLAAPGLAQSLNPDGTMPGLYAPDGPGTSPGLYAPDPQHPWGIRAPKAGFTKYLPVPSYNPGVGVVPTHSATESPATVDFPGLGNALAAGLASREQVQNSRQTRDERAAENAFATQLIKLSQEYIDAWTSGSQISDGVRATIRKDTLPPTAQDIEIQQIEQTSLTKYPHNIADSLIFIKSFYGFLTPYDRQIDISNAIAKAKYMEEARSKAEREQYDRLAAIQHGVNPESMSDADLMAAGRKFLAADYAAKNAQAEAELARLRAEAGKH